MILCKKLKKDVSTKFYDSESYMCWDIHKNPVERWRIEMHSSSGNGKEFFEQTSNSNNHNNNI